MSDATLPIDHHQPVPPASASVAAQPRLDRRGAAPLLGVIALSALINTWRLAQNGYANVYYSAGVKSMLRSWHNFLYLSADPGGLISIDKPPLGLWLQAASAELFGFSPLSLLLPEAIAGVLTVAALYAIVRKRFGTLAATVSALTLATFPVFVAVVRDNNVDALLILLLTLACGTALRASESGRLRTLLAAGALVALAFNTKALAAYLLIPPIAVAYFCCAPASLRRRVAHLLLAGVLCGVLSLSWMVAVDLTPASQRPFVGSSTNNSELGLTFGYNGFGRVSGQKGGPGAVANREVLPQVDANASTSAPLTVPAPLPRPSPDTQPKIARTITAGPVAFGTAPGALRLFRSGFGDQGAWMLVFALIGLIALALTHPVRRDPKLAATIVFGGFLICEAGFLSLSKGIVHPYYLSALAPGTAVMVGVGVDAIPRLGHPQSQLLGFAAVLGNAAVQVALLRHAHYLALWQALLLPAAAVAALIAMRRRSLSASALVGALLVLLVAPTAYSLTTWREPVEGTFPAAGPRVVSGNGGAALSATQLAVDEALMRYVVSHHADGRFQLLTQASLTADSPILLGLRAAALGGYGGVDPALDGPGLGRLVATGQARYVVLGGGYAYLGGNAASTAAAHVCPEVPAAVWLGTAAPTTEDLYLVDCAGQAQALERQP